MTTPRRDNETFPVGTGNGGFTLIEVIVALVILTIGILTVNAMQTVAVRGNMTASNITEGSTWAADQAEVIFNMPYDDLVDSNGSGTGQDANQNGIDDDDEGTNVDGIGNFGLDDTTSYDGSVPNPDLTGYHDDYYTVVWNVADYPLPNIKTIYVHVTWQERGDTKTVTIRHTKARYM